jgi:hypothetical protein
VLVCVAYDFGVIGGCKESREVVVKAWMELDDEEYQTEKEAYRILSASPMKGCPSLIEFSIDPRREIYALVLEKLGPSLKDLCNLKSPNLRFDEKMTLALAIQMVRDFFFLLISFPYLFLILLYP